MSITFGFYNSMNGDRKYDAIEMSKLFDGLIADGVFATVGESLMVTEKVGMGIIVSSGRAWFNHTWTLNDANLILNIASSHLVLNRIDTVILEVNSEAASRSNSIKILEGTAGSDPVPATLTKTELVNQYPLAQVYVGAGVTDITQANITNKIGTADCPFVTGVIDTINADSLLLQWDSEYDAWQSGVDSDWEAWFATIQGALDGDPAGNLLAMINALTYADVGAQVAGTYNTRVGTDADISLSAAEVLASVTLTDGVVSAHSKRTLTLAHLGYTGATNANNYTYTHPTYSGDDFSLDTGLLSGATVVSDIDINVSTDSLGHVTDANGTVATRNLTPANIGALADHETAVNSDKVDGYHITKNGSGGTGIINFITA